MNIPSAGRTALVRGSHTRRMVVRRGTRRGTLAGAGFGVIGARATGAVSGQHPRTCARKTNQTSRKRIKHQAAEATSWAAGIPSPCGTATSPPAKTASIGSRRRTGPPRSRSVAPLKPSSDGAPATRTKTSRPSAATPARGRSRERSRETTAKSAQGKHLSMSTIICAHHGTSEHTSDSGHMGHIAVGNNGATMVRHEGRGVHHGCLRGKTQLEQYRRNKSVRERMPIININNRNAASAPKYSKAIFGV